jgi:hypothetical protein
MSGQENFEELESVEDEIELLGDHQDEKIAFSN